MFNRYWNFTTCIRTDNIDAIEQEITHLLEQEGCRRLTQLPQHEGSLEQIQAVHPWEQSCNPWIISLFAGKSGWTIVKTSPSELLCQRTEGAIRPRLSVLAMQLGCDAFHLGVYWSQVGILLEADATGRTFISGAFGLNRPTEQFYEERINLPGSLKQFSLLKVPELMAAAMRVNQDPELQRKKAEVDKLLSENANSALLPAPMDEVFEGYTERIDRALAKVIAISKSWYWFDLTYDIYAHPEQLAAAEARLLYFQPPTTYKPGKAYTLSPSELEAILGTAEEDETAYNDPPYSYLDSGAEVYGEDVPW